MKTIVKQRKARASESGNVLFLILIAVALFAALSYAVTQSTRSSGGDAGRETNRISSAQLTQYPASVRTSIVRMIIGGQDVDRLEFNAPEDFGDCTQDPPTSNPPRYPRCVFHPTGGGATHVLAPGSLMASGNPGGWIFNGENQIENVGTTAGTPNSSTVDLIAFLPGITQGVCESINTELGLPVPAPTLAGIDFTSASNMVNPDGNTATSLAADGGTIAGDLSGQPFGCFQQPALNYVYYHVLVER